jgi:hypothetical protein
MLVSRTQAGQAGGVLNEQERAILGFEGNWWTHQGDKDALVLERFGLSPDRYTAVLAELLDRPEALAHDPLVVRRLRRMRDRSRRARVDGAAARSEERA